MRPAELSTEELCLAWRPCYTWLHKVADGPHRQQVIRAREQMLDELERRNKAGFNRWIADGARAGSDPPPATSHPAVNFQLASACRMLKVGVAAGPDPVEHVDVVTELPPEASPVAGPRRDDVGGARRTE